MINLVYIRAAIEANTGIRLSLDKTREYLVEEGLITQKQADDKAQIFTGYGDLYWTDVPSKDVEMLIDDREGLPEKVATSSPFSNPYIRKV